MPLSVNVFTDSRNSTSKSHYYRFEHRYTVNTSNYQPQFSFFFSFFSILTFGVESTSMPCYFFLTNGSKIYRFFVGLQKGEPNPEMMNITDALETVKYKGKQNKSDMRRIIERYDVAGILKGALVDC